VAWVALSEDEVKWHKMHMRPPWIFTISEEQARFIMRGVVLIEKSQFSQEIVMTTFDLESMAFEELNQAMHFEWGDYLIRLDDRVLARISEIDDWEKENEYDRAEYERLKKKFEGTPEKEEAGEGRGTPKET
jgi:hypothetical protein